jgi:hypothetical protein
VRKRWGWGWKVFGFKVLALTPESYTSDGGLRFLSGSGVVGDLGVEKRRVTCS